MAKLTTKTCSYLLTFLSIILFSSASLASEQATTKIENIDKSLQQLHELRLHSLRSITNYLMYSNLEGDPKYKSQLEDHRETVLETINSLQASLTDNTFSTQVTGLSNQWDKVNKLININIKDIQDQGYSDLRMVSEMMTETRAFIDIASTTYTNLQNTTGFQIAHWTERSRNLSLLMQNMTVLYVGRMSTEFGVVSIGSDEPIDKLALQFKESLNDMKNIKINTPEISDTLSRISTKWHFIEKSLMNPNTDAIPYLITRYSDRITNSMELIATHYQEQNS